VSAMIEKALATARDYREVDGAALHEATAGLKRKLDRLLPVELDARQELESRLAELYREGMRVKSVNAIGLPVLDERVLEWRREKERGVPLPVFAVTSLGHPETSFHVSGRYDDDRNFVVSYLQVTPQAPRFMRERYDDVLNGMWELSRRKRAVVFLGTRYTGVIPDAARQAILDSPFDTDELYLLREVPREDWHLSVKEVKPPPRPARHWDPIVVGVRDASMYVVTTFDPTPLESYVAEEFALLSGARLDQLQLGR